MNKKTIQFFLDHTFQLPTNSKLANKYKLPQTTPNNENIPWICILQKYQSNKTTQNCFK